MKKGSDEPLRYCRKCMIRDMNEDAFFRELHAYMEQIEPSRRVSAETYQERLNECMNCEELLSGMCRICGMYVEMRALLRTSICPLFHPRWRQEQDEERTEK